MVPRLSFSRSPSVIMNSNPRSSVLPSPLLISVSRSAMLCLLSQLLLLSARSGHIIGATDDLALTRGVPLMKRALYNPNLQTFACLDGSRLIPVNQVNDDYCDCKDGSDEPGTSACPQGTFYCANFEYTPLVIPSSRVNDGICDCCDGTDEWRGVTQCVNSCVELGKVLREETEKQLTLKREGWAKRLEYSIQGRKEHDERTNKLEELREKKSGMQADRDEAERAKNAAEAVAKEAKDKHEADWEALKALRREELRRLAAEKAFLSLDFNSDGLLTPAELADRHDLDVDGDGAMSIFEATTLIGESGVGAENFLANVWSNIETKYKASAEVNIDPSPAAEEADLRSDAEDSAPPSVEVGEDAPTPSVEALPLDEPFPEDPVEGSDKEERERDVHGYERDYERDDDQDYAREDEREDDEDNYPEDEDDDHHDDDHHDDEHPSTTDSGPDAFDEELDLAKPDYDADAKAQISAADAARSAFDKIDERFREVEREMNEVEKIVGLDLGRSFEFSPLHGKCFDFKDREYLYTLCLYDRASQRPKDGGGETSLGTFTGWEGGYQLMKYEHGQGCWNGPNRSAKVHLSCGGEEKLTSVSEPSRCEYEFRMTTPAVCESPPDKEEPVEPPPPESLKDEL